MKNKISAYKLFLFLFPATLLFNASIYGASTEIKTNVLVAGGTASGTSAAIQAARNGAQVVLIESTPWLGGMLTMAGVSATDGNHLLPSGLWGEFRNHLYDYYGGPHNVETGWVSNTQFEPHVGNQIFASMVSNEDRIIRVQGYHIVKCILDGSRVMGAVFINESATDTLTVKADISVDATETGDLLALSGCKYFIGQDAKSATGEKGAPDKATDIIQDITYVAILKDYGKGADKTVAKPENYSPEQYECTCNGACNNKLEERYTCESMLNYGRLPNGKYMINWPYKGNDFYLNDLEMDYYARKEAWKQAKNHTLGWLYFVQTQAGYSNLGLADDEFPTSDHLAFYPYYRESRRVDGVFRLTNDDLTDPYKNSEKPYFRYAISVGDYPLDLHHKKMPVDIYFDVEAIASFSVPYGCLVPKQVNGLIVAEKSISVTHIANGCTRLQPSVMLIGQAAGAAAALCVKEKSEPRDMNVRELQQSLLDAGCWLLSYIDVTPDSPYFQSVQKVALCGIMRGEGVAEDWANKTFFYPELSLTQKEFDRIILILKGEKAVPLDLPAIRNEKKLVSREKVLLNLWKISSRKDDLKKATPASIAAYLNKRLPECMNIDTKDLKGYATREETASWIDALINPFQNKMLLTTTADK